MRSHQLTLPFLMQTLEGFILLSDFRFFSDLAKLANHFPKNFKSLPENVKDLFSSSLFLHKESLIVTGLPTTALLVVNLSAELKQLSFTPDALCQRLRAIDDTFRAELGSHSFLHLDQSKASFYYLAEPFGLEVTKRFPSASFDIMEATKCYALERPTACVLHLMRVLETGLSVLAQSLNLRFNEPTWHQVLGKIEQKIKAIEKLKRKPKDWKKNRQFYSEAATDFRFIKDAWRNYAMHARQKYTEQEAKDIYDHISSFMRHLSTKLKE
jgi:hypothetical protein